LRGRLVAAGLIASVVLLFATSGKADITSADALTAPSEDLSSLSLVGRSELRIAFFKIFDSALFTRSGDWDEPTTGFRFEITYQRTISGAFLARQTEKEWDHLGFEHASRRHWQSVLLAMWPDVKKGDTIIFDVDEAGASRFYFNGNWMGSIEARDFAPAFIAIWLSPKTSRPAHRGGLLAE
jgi:hypothetical protein